MRKILKAMKKCRKQHYAEAISPLPVRTGIERREIEAVLALYFYGSIAKAAEALGTKPANARKKLGELEFKLGIRLFEQGGKRRTPTPAGRVFLSRTAQIVTDFHALVEASRRIGDGKVGQIAIGYYGPVAHGALRTLLFEDAGFLADIVRKPVELGHDQMRDALASGRIDLAILRGRPDQMSAHCIPLWVERIVILLPAGHRLLAKPDLQWSDLVEETFLVSRHGPCAAIRGLLVDRMSPFGAEPDIRLQDIGTMALYQMVGAGHGICLALESSLGDHYADTEYRDLSGPGGSENVTFYACWCADNLNPALGRFLTALRQGYANVDGGA